LSDPDQLPVRGWVAVDRGRIAEIGEGAPPSPAAAGDRDSIVCPAFTDAHVHLPQMDAIGCQLGVTGGYGGGLGRLVLLGFGLAASSLVGQALGGGERADAARWGWEVSRLALVFVALLELPVALFPELFLGIFIHDPETLALASLPMRLVALTLWWDALGTVLLNAHQGAGHNRRAMAISVSMQWGIFLPLAYLLGPVLGFGLLQIWLANISYRCVQALIFLWSWRQGHWAEVRV
ncbi:MAG: hypothetical protein IH800_17580, partial [Myxococcales bacterium]|nr:hypothetical protein [Myxococcales bacterium]